MDLLEVLGLSPPAADSAVCFELYDESFIQGASEAALDALAIRCMQLLMPYLESYIWQHEPLRLQSSLTQVPPWQLKKQGKRKDAKQQQQQQLPCLWGALRYEDNVEDEWFVVWLLMELSRQMPQLAVRVWDDDGDFLLIEAAYALPRWLKPETSTNRVWLRRGALHVIPPPSVKAPQLPPHPSVRDALNILQSGQFKTHNERIEAPILLRLAGYPARAKQQLQRTTAWLPHRVALLLQQEPQLVSAAVGAFMNRQREDVQSAAKLSNFPPTQMTTALVSLNRCMYAQLLQADFVPPKGYPQPPAGWLGGSTAKQDKALHMGLKITTGMEIMCLRMGVSAASSAAGMQAASEAAAAAGTAAQELQSGEGHLSQQQQQQQQQQPTPAQLASNPAWRHYLATLKTSGYFSDELEGSARYKQLLAAAAAAFSSSDAYVRSCEAAAAPARRLQQLLAAIDASGMAPAATDSCSSNNSTATCQQQQQHGLGAAAGSYPGALKLLPTAAVLSADGLSEDSDSWMAEEAEKAQQQLEAQEAEMAAHEAKKQQQQARKGPPAAAGGDEELVVDAEQLVSGFKGFVQHVAGHEGAEVPEGVTNSVTNTACNTQAPAAAAAAQTVKSRSAAAAASSGSGVELNPDAFLAELMGVMGPAAPVGLSSSGSSAAKPLQQQQQKPADADALMSQLQSLQQQLMQVLQEGGNSSAAAAAAAAAAGYDSDDDEYGSSSSDEGPSFYGSDDEEGSTTDDSEGLGGLHHKGRGPVQLPVPPPSSGAERQQQQQQQWQLPPSFRASKLQEAWEVMTATDSDDELHSEDEGSEEDALSLGAGGEGSEEEQEEGAGAAGAGFFDAYASAMEAELAATTLAETFERLPPLQQQQQGLASAAGASSSSAGVVGVGAGLAPLDVDMNLIKSLVASYTAQGGLPGPASNLAGLLGLQLPTEVVEEK